MYCENPLQAPDLTQFYRDGARKAQHSSDIVTKNQYAAMPGSALALLVARIRIADHADNPFAAHHFAVPADLLN